MSSIAVILSSVLARLSAIARKESHGGATCILGLEPPLFAGHPRRLGRLPQPLLVLAASFCRVALLFAPVIVSSASRMKCSASSLAASNRRPGPEPFSRC